MCIPQYVVDVYLVTLWSETTERRSITTTVGATLSHWRLAAACLPPHSSRRRCDHCQWMRTQAQDAQHWKSHNVNCREHMNVLWWSFILVYSSICLYLSVEHHLNDIITLHLSSVNNVTSRNPCFKAGGPRRVLSSGEASVNFHHVSILLCDDWLHYNI